MSIKTHVLMSQYFTLSHKKIGSSAQLPTKPIFKSFSMTEFCRKSTGSQSG